MNKIYTTCHFSTEWKLAHIFSTLWPHNFLPWLRFWPLHGLEKHYTKSKTSSLMPEGRSKWEEVKKMVLDKLVTPILGAGVLKCQWGFTVPACFSCVQVRLSSDCGWDQDPDQAAETLTWSGLPGQRHRPEGLWGKRACLRDAHHRCFSHLQHHCSWFSN